MKNMVKEIARTHPAMVCGFGIEKYHPIIVGVTGSVGKSSTKEAIALVLSAEYTVRKSEGNYNNESASRSPFSVNEVRVILSLVGFAFSSVRVSSSWFLVGIRIYSFSRWPSIAQAICSISSHFCRSRWVSSLVSERVISNIFGRSMRSRRKRTARDEYE